MMFHLTHLFFGAVTLVLPHEAHVRGTELHLADLVQVRGDAAEIEKLASLSIGYAPAPGYTRLVRRDELARQVQAAFPGSAIEIEGAEACRVIPDVERVDGASIRAAAENEMRALFASRDAAIGLQGEVQSLDVPRAITKRELRALIEQRELHAGAWSVPVQVWIDGGLYQTIWTSIQVDVYEALPVLVRDLRRGEWLAPNAVEMRRVRTTNALAGAPLASEAIAGALALRDMPAGTVLTDRDVQRARLVRQGDTVQLQVKKGAITARSTAIAKQDGAIGDRIRVTTNDRNLEITAVIVGRELVEVDLSRAPVNFTASGSQPTDAIALARSNAR